jgi:AcrR family transcriptional regulator
MSAGDDKKEACALTAKSRREREREETRRKICDAARELFAQFGYEAVTMRNIAQRIEYTPTCIYFHFADKEALFRHICREDFAQFAAEMTPGEPIVDPLARIRSLGQLYLDFARRHPNHFRLLFMTDLPELKDQCDAPVVEPSSDVYLTLVRACQDAIDAGLVRPEFSDALTLAQTYWAGVHGVASLHLVKNGREPQHVFSADRVGSVMLDTLQRGLARCPDTVAAARGDTAPESVAA